MDAVARPLLSSAELMLWSAGAGAIGLVVLLALADTLYSRTRAALQTLTYLALCWLVVMLLCGLPAAIWPGLKEPLGVAQILSGPLCAAMGSFGASQWLSAHQRDRLMKVSLLTITLFCLIGGPLCLLLAPAWRLPASGALAIANLSVVLWLSVRATQLGDKLAWGLALGCLLTLPAQIGLYGLALNTSRPSAAWQAAVVMAALLSLVITTAMLWLRNRQTRQLAQGDVSRRDPITQLYSSVVMVQKIIRAQHRRQRTRRDGALMAVMVFEPERLLPQVGQSGLNDLYIQLARRMQRHTGAVNPAGRYYDRCFVVLLETMHSPRWIRTLGLRVASSLRRPMEVPSHERAAHPDHARHRNRHRSPVGRRQGRGPVAARSPGSGRGRPRHAFPRGNARSGNPRCRAGGACRAGLELARAEKRRQAGRLFRIFPQQDGRRQAAPCRAAPPQAGLNNRAAWTVNRLSGRIVDIDELVGQAQLRRDVRRHRRRAVAL
jgi:GGDEF domain-containing protein